MNKRLVQLMKSPKHLPAIPSVHPSQSHLTVPRYRNVSMLRETAMKMHLGHIPMIIVSHYQGSCGSGSKQRNPPKSADRLFLIQRMVW